MEHHRRRAAAARGHWARRLIARATVLLVAMLMAVGYQGALSAETASAAPDLRDRVSCDGYVRMFELRADGRELWYSSVARADAGNPRAFSWAKIHDFGADRPARAIAAHNENADSMYVMVTDNNGGLRAMGISKETKQSSVRDLYQGTASDPGPYAFSRFTSDGRRLYGTKGGELFVMTGHSNWTEPRAIRSVGNIGYPRAFFGISHGDNEIAITNSGNQLRYLNVTHDDNNVWSYSTTVVRSSGWGQHSVTSPGGGLLMRASSNNALWRHHVGQLNGTNTSITSHDVLAASGWDRTNPMTTIPTTCSVVQPDPDPEPDPNYFLASTPCPTQNNEFRVGLNAGAAEALDCTLFDQGSISVITSGNRSNHPDFCNDPNDTSDHCTGDAIDVGPLPAPPGSATGVRRGWYLAHWYQTNAERLGIDYIIYAHYRWPAYGSGVSRWVPYDYPYPNCEFEKDCSHEDHVHVSVDTNGGNPSAGRVDHAPVTRNPNHVFRTADEVGP